MPYVHFLNIAAHILRTEIVLPDSPWVFPYLAELRHVQRVHENPGTSIDEQMLERLALSVLHERS